MSIAAIGVEEAKQLSTPFDKTGDLNIMPQFGFDSGLTVLLLCGVLVGLDFSDRPTMGEMPTPAQKQPHDADLFQI